MALIECIPNFSEGRRQEVVDQIVQAISAVPGIVMLDRSSDADHNRSVITFVGEPQAVGQAAFEGIRTAAQLIDMETHQGEHPRLGATDVVPFVPLEGITLEECAALARQLGERVGNELGLPVYFYEAAALRPERTNLENIRRGEYEGIKASMGVDPTRIPDAGPAQMGKAGAVVIGARPPLIAYNVYLSTNDVDAAKKIAKAVRQSSGGLRFVKGLGLLVDGRAQVSMNLTDFTKTPIAHVMEMIRSQTARYGTQIHHSELVGLIPQAALIDAAQYYLQLDQFKADQVLETRMRSLASQSENAGKNQFLDQIAAGTPTPGGGSAAAHAGAMAAALVAMVARLTLGKKKYAEVQDRMAEIAMRADELRAQLQEAVQRDAEAFEAVMTAMKLPKDSEARPPAVEAATHQAALVPLEVARQAVEVMQLAVEVAATGNSNAATDAGSAVAMARAALISAGLNVKVNAMNVTDHSAAERWLGTLNLLDTQATAYEGELKQVLHSRANIS